jgi:FkbM family methyltransferase
MKIRKHLEENKENYKPWIEGNQQGMIELKILPFLQDIENGVFVEAGAHDGLFQSNTKILEDLGWSGVLIEPSVSAYEQCKLNRKSIVENCALVSFDYDQDTITGIFDGTPRASVMPDTDNVVKAKTLTSILLENNIKHVDILCLDVEGYELEALKGVDFNLINFKFLLVEVNTYSYSLETLVLFLESKGFKLIKNISNFRFDNTPGWPGNHQDYLFEKI